jgi:hypothetical protein
MWKRGEREEKASPARPTPSRASPAAVPDPPPPVLGCVNTVVGTGEVVVVAPDATVVVTPGGLDVVVVAGADEVVVASAGLVVVAWFTTAVLGGGLVVLDVVTAPPSTVEVGAAVVVSGPAAAVVRVVVPSGRTVEVVTPGPVAEVLLSSPRRMATVATPTPNRRRTRANMAFRTPRATDETSAASLEVAPPP